MATEGSKWIEVAGLGDRRQLTAVFGASLAGDFLLPQIIYAGKTPHCLPTMKFPEDWDITLSQNHWAMKTTETHIIKVLVAYIETCRKKSSFPTDHAAIVIYDKLKGQYSSSILSLLDCHHINLVIVPPNCTDHLQPLDVSVNKAVKENLWKQVSELIFFSRIQVHWWYSNATSSSQHVCCEAFRSYTANEHVLLHQSKPFNNHKWS